MIYLILAILVGWEISMRKVAHRDKEIEGLKSQMHDLHSEKVILHDAVESYHEMMNEMQDAA